MMDEPMTDEHMPKPIGPTIPRWQLGEELDRLRKKADYTRQQIATRLRCSVSKIEKIEGGQVGIKVGDLEIMLAEYGLDRDDWPPLLELQRLGNTRGWWSKFGRMPAPFTEFLGLEMAAETIRIFELAVVPGLFQTEEYARALTGRPPWRITRRAVRARGRPAAWAARSSSSPTTHRRSCSCSTKPHCTARSAVPRSCAQQLDHLVELGETVHIQVVPFEHGATPASPAASSSSSSPTTCTAPSCTSRGRPATSSWNGPRTCSAAPASTSTCSAPH